MTKDCSNTSDCGRLHVSVDENVCAETASLKNIPRIDIYFVMSMDGVVALDHNRDIRDYSSREDREFFLNSIKSYDAIIVSSRTFVKDASPGTRRVILTHSKRSENDTDPFNIYMSGDVRRICAQMWDMGIRKAALATGPSTCLSFLRSGLVNDLYLSIEPVSLGSGIRLFTDEKYISRWTLVELRQLNENGTLMMHYHNISSDLHDPDGIK